MDVNNSFAEADDMEDLQHYMSLLTGNNTLKIQYETICKIINTFLQKVSIQEVEEKVLQHVMPAIRNLFVTIYKEISNISNAGEKQTNSICTVKLLQDCIVMCLGSFEVLECILTNLLENDVINLCYIQTVPPELVTILLCTFQHCKESTKIYHVYINELKEIIQLFKCAQDIHLKLLQLLVSHVNFNFEIEHQIVLLTDVLHGLEEIGEVVVGMNNKTFADNWKGYMVLVERNINVLAGNNFGIIRPLEFASHSINRNLENVIKMNESDQKAYSPILKMCDFLLKIIVKLCNLFWKQSVELSSILLSVIECLTSIYRFYPPHLYFKGNCDNIASGIDNHVIKGCDTLIEKCLTEPKFIRVLGSLNIEGNSGVSGTLFLLLELFSKLNKMDNVVDTIEVYILVEVAFKAIKDGYVELFWSIQTSPAAEKELLFNVLCRNIIKVILLLNTEQFSKIETIFMENILQGSIWNALAVIEIWTTVLGHKGFEITYTTLVQVATCADALLKNIFTHRPERVLLEHLLYRLYISLPETYRIQLIEKYSLSSHLHLWRCLTFKDFPKNCMVFIESLLISTVEKTEDFKNGKCTSIDFQFLCDSFDAIGNLPTLPYIDLNHLITTIVKLWDFEVNRTSLTTNSLLVHFIKKLFCVTSNFTHHLTEHQLLCVLSKVKELCSTSFQVEILHMLKMLSDKSLHHSSEKNQIISLMSSIFTLVHRDSNPMIKQLFLETFVHFLKTTSHEEILQSVVKTNQAIECEISNFIQQTIINQRGTQVLSADDYFTKQKCYVFRHECPEVIHRAKKVCANNDQLDVIVKRIGNDLELLYSLSDKKFVKAIVDDLVTSLK